MADPNVSADEAQEIRSILESVESSGAADSATLESITLGGTKEAFCDSWPTVKEVLGFLKEFAPSGIRQAIALVVRGGDLVHGRICQQ